MNEVLSSGEARIPIRKCLQFRKENMGVEFGRELISFLQHGQSLPVLVEV